ncbi:MAG: hypothetical protein WC262_12310 [Bacteroidales bacterium]|jgi:hypothetical protein
MTQLDLEEQIKVDVIRNLIVLLIGQKAGCRLSDLERSRELDLFRATEDLDVGAIVDSLVRAGKVVRMRFGIPVYGWIELLFPEGTVFQSD